MRLDGGSSAYIPVLATVRHSRDARHARPTPMGQWPERRRPETGHAVAPKYYKRVWRTGSVRCVMTDDVMAQTLMPMANVAYFSVVYYAQISKPSCSSMTTWDLFKLVQQCDRACKPRLFPMGCHAGLDEPVNVTGAISRTLCVTQRLCPRFHCSIAENPKSTYPLLSYRRFETCGTLAL